MPINNYFGTGFIFPRNRGGNMRSNIFVALFVILVSFVLTPAPVHADQYLTASRVKHIPVIDGSGDDKAWKSARSITVPDNRTGGDVTIHAVYTENMIYFLVRYPDPREDRLHKPWIWDKTMEVYTFGPQREDTFTFKWNMENKKVNLSNFSDDAYSADVWYWKANRSDPAGYSDDKIHILAAAPGKKATELTSVSGKKRYLMRIGDEGASADKKRIVIDYQGDVVDQYESVIPEGSRADVRAKGVWKNGVWTVEFGRKLNTGHSDDIQFDPASSKKYQFGISVAGLYGEKIDKTSPDWYGQGRISETIYLGFQ